MTTHNVYVNDAICNNDTSQIPFADCCYRPLLVFVEVSNDGYLVIIYAENILNCMTCRVNLKTNRAHEETIRCRRCLNKISNDAGLPFRTIMIQYLKQTY